MAVDADTPTELIIDGEDQRDEAEHTEAAATAAQPSSRESKRTSRHLRHVWIAGLAIVVVLAGLTGWLGYRGYQVKQSGQRHELFLQAARQGALNLTTISHTDVDADVQRILDSATGAFFDDFQQRSKPFIEVVRQAQSTSVGEIKAAGIETENADSAQVLVAVTVKTSTAAGADQQPRSWRMRMTVQRVVHGAKMVNVEFLP